jgi:4-amino-4-deoxy-L-arabinose transferase-like glycosyltransferase
MMGLWPIVAYYFYKCVKYNRIKDWTLFGLTSGLAFLDKYQIVFLFIGLFLYLIFVDREQFKRKGLYLSILVGSIVILPHVIWLFRNDFFSFAYMFERAEISNSATSKFAIMLNHFIYPIKFIGDQILAVLPCVGIYLILAIQAKNIKISPSPLPFSTTRTEFSLRKASHKTILNRFARQSPSRGEGVCHDSRISYLTPLLIFRRGSMCSKSFSGQFIFLYSRFLCAY